MRPAVSRVPNHTTPTTTTVTGFNPFNMPVTADDTRSSAKANKLSGTAIHTSDSEATRGHADLGSARRADGTNDKTVKPMTMRAHPMNAGSSDSSDNAMR